MKTQTTEQHCIDDMASELPVPQSERGAQRKDDRNAILAAFDRDQLRWNNIDVTVLSWMIAMHLGVLAAPFFFTWNSLAAAAGLHWLTCSIGVCLGYHRCLSHCSLGIVAPVQFATTLCGVLSGQGTPLMWSAVHRLHHSRSDKQGDPHSPRNGVLWSHFLWLFVNHDRPLRKKLFRTYAPDLIDDPMLNFFERTYLAWHVAFAALTLAIGGWALFLWAVCVRVVLGYHTTWLINSASHIWGYQNYQTTDDSKNLWWAGLLAYGEGWHNNHHAWPHVACYGHRWWEFDMTWQAIKLLRFLRLATDVDGRIPRRDSQPQCGT